MGRRLNTYVHVHVDGETRVYGPGDKVPGAVAKLISAPGVWEEDGSSDADTSSASTTDSGGGTDPAGSSETPPATAAGTDPAAPPAGADADTVAPPPKKGKGSGVEAWRKYADAKGFDIDADVNREDIIHALTAAGIPTE